MATNSTTPNRMSTSSTPLRMDCGGADQGRSGLSAGIGGATTVALKTLTALLPFPRGRSLSTCAHAAAGLVVTPPTTPFFYVQVFGGNSNPQTL
jgi:hypothetical protein